MFNTELGIFCNLHEDWAELLAEEPYYLKIKEDGPYVMFNYDQIRSDFRLSIVREARGIIFRKGSWENPVCWAFDKFGNYGESYVPNIDWATSFVTEKVDGSLIKVWYDDNTWHISTNGTIDAGKAELSTIKFDSFGSYFSNTVCRYYPTVCQFVDGLDKNLTYMFELVGPYNRVVIPYEEPAIYFLGARNKYTGKQYTCDAVSMLQLGVSKFRRPTVYPLTSVEDCIKATEALGWDEEGFVVLDRQFNRVKIKSPAYVRAHYARNNNVITRKHLIKIILANEVEEFLCYAADYKDCLLEVKKQVDTFFKIGNQLIAACQALRGIPRSTFAEFVQTFPPMFQGLMFFNYNRLTTVEEFTSTWSAEKWEGYLDKLKKLINS